MDTRVKVVDVLTNPRHEQDLFIPRQIMAVAAPPSAGAPADREDVQRAQRSGGQHKYHGATGITSRTRYSPGADPHRPLRHDAAGKGQHYADHEQRNRKEHTGTPQYHGETVEYGGGDDEASPRAHHGVRFVRLETLGDDESESGIP